MIKYNFIDYLWLEEVKKMEEKKSLKISLSTLLLLLAIIVIVVMVCFIYKLYKDKQSKISELNNFELDSKNKYTIITDLRWNTMQNDGGSHSSLYYQIDLDNNIISKVQEDYHANLGGTSSKQKSVIYIKKIDTNIQVEVKSLVDEIITKEDINETHNYNFFTISSLNTEKDIYNINTIENINVLLKKIDELKN